MNALTLTCANEAQMQSLGQRIASAVKPRSIILLSGELGAGKSVLARSMIHAAGYTGRVKSPTYTLLESYEIDNPRLALRTIAHLDLYRLADPDELYFIGFDDVLVNYDLVLIEWPEKASERLPVPTVNITIEYSRESLQVRDEQSHEVSGAGRIVTMTSELISFSELSLLENQ